MNVIEKIEVKLVSLARQKIIEVKKSYLELRDNSIKVVLRFTSEDNDNDDLAIWTVYNHNVEIIVRKAAIKGLEKCWLQNTEKWKVIVMASELREEMAFFFEAGKEANDFLNKMDNYLFSNDVN